MTRRYKHHVKMMAITFIVVMVSFELPEQWMAVIQAAIGGASFGAHFDMWLAERKKPAMAS